MTGHIMWTKPLQAGGIVGGNQTIIPGVTYFEGSAYSQRYVNPIIMEGLLYYTEPVGFNGPSSGTHRLCQSANRTSSMATHRRSCAIIRHDI